MEKGHLTAISVGITFCIEKFIAEFRDQQKCILEALPNGFMAGKKSLWIRMPDMFSPIGEDEMLEVNVSSGANRGALNEVY
jgi:hypothetical protein